MGLIDNDLTPQKLHIEHIVLLGGRLGIFFKDVSHINIITLLGCDHNGAEGHFVVPKRSRYKMHLQQLSIASGDGRKISIHLASSVPISQVPIAQIRCIGQILFNLLSPSTNNCRQYQYEICAATKL